MSSSDGWVGSIRRLTGRDRDDDDVGSERERSRSTETDGGSRSGPRTWFDQLREWSATGAIREAIRERAGPIVIAVGRKARVPYEVASDPDVHVTAEWSKTGQHGADNADPRDHRHYNPDRFDDRDRLHRDRDDRGRGGRWR